MVGKSKRRKHRWAVREKTITYNWGGASGYYSEKAPGYGVYYFKKGFGAQLIEYVNEFDIVFHPTVNLLFELGKIARRVIKEIG